jgi:hypothetical protein
MVLMEGEKVRIHRGLKSGKPSRSALGQEARMLSGMFCTWIALQCFNHGGQNVSNERDSPVTFLDGEDSGFVANPRSRFSVEFAVTPH